MNKKTRVILLGVGGCESGPGHVWCVVANVLEKKQLLFDANVDYEFVEGDEFVLSGEFLPRRLAEVHPKNSFFPAHCVPYSTFVPTR